MPTNYRSPSARFGIARPAAFAWVALLCTLGGLTAEQVDKAKAPALSDRLSPALEKVKGKSGERKVLIVALPPQGGEQETWRFASWLRDQSAAVLLEKGTDAVIASEVEAILAKENRSGGLLKSDLANFLKLSSAELLLQISYARVGPKRTASYLLVDAKDRVLLRENVALGKDDAELAGYVPDLNRKVVAYVRAQKGKKVGDGECWTLAAEGLRAAEAHVPAEPMLYVFGKELGPRDPIFPGDIIQLEKARFETKMKRPINFNHHTAVVLDVLGADTVQVIQQNFGDDKAVTLLPLQLKDMTQGTIQIYRPQPKSTAKKD